MLNWSVLSSYSFLVVALGTMLLAAAAGAVGCISVLKGQSLIGDAIGHSAFPGVVLAFMLFMQRNPLILMLGAIFSGTVAYLTIQLMDRHSPLDLDAILAVVLSTFFGLGMVLKSLIQGNPNYAGASQSGLQNYIFGQAAYMMRADIVVISIVAIVSLLLLVLFYKEVKVFVFDPIYSRSIGISDSLMQGIVLVMTMGLIAAGLKVVGAVLIASLLIIPAITAMQWSDSFGKVLFIAALTGGVSAFIGTYISTVYEGMSTGPTIIVVMSILAFLSLIFGPHGMLANLRMRRLIDDLGNFYEMVL